MAKKKPSIKIVENVRSEDYTDAELVAYCGINCELCRAKSHQRRQLASKLKDSLQELPLDLFSQILPPFKNIKQVMEFLDFLPKMGGQTCCTDKGSPCGDPGCVIRTCVKSKDYKTCAECTDYKACTKLDFLKPFHPTLTKDLDTIKENGVGRYIDDVVAKSQLDPINIK